MGYLDSLNITGSALTAERFRTDIIMQNLANQNTTRTAEGGPYVRKQVKKHIFDRFYRADSARSDKLHYGLGLSIARELVLLHGGSISVSDSPSGGACFCVRLPMGHC